jgi:dCMP deaminase
MTSWTTYLLGFAHHAATKSKDSTQVGAVLVAPDERSVLLTAYNGPPAGVEDNAERRERPAKYLWACHAEQNLAAKAARFGIRTEGCSVYVTHMSCSTCARTLIQAGIARIVCDAGTTSMPAEEFAAAETMLREANVELIRPKPPVARRDLQP